jgi:hypothetical protein
MRYNIPTWPLTSWLFFSLHTGYTLIAFFALRPYIVLMVDKKDTTHVMMEGELVVYQRERSTIWQCRQGDGIKPLLPRPMTSGPTGKCCEALGADLIYLCGDLGHDANPALKLCAFVLGQSKNTSLQPHPRLTLR